MSLPIKRELGTQPLDDLMTRLGIANADLVRASDAQLSFKVVQKGRKGRRLTLHTQKKILQAITAAQPNRIWTLQDLFNY